MPSELPSGFKSREEYNDYMRKYNQRYRRRKKAEREKKQIELLALQGENKFLKVKVATKKMSPEEMAWALDNPVTMNNATMEGQEITINYGEQKDERNKK